jgi:transcriptional regulator with XRE-family HTH domain
MDTTAVTAAKQPPSRAVAAEFRAELARQRLSQRQFATKLGVPNGWVARRLTLFEAAITVDDAHLMAEALEFYYPGVKFG